MEHLQTLAVTLMSFAHQLHEQGVPKSRIEARISPFMSDVQSIVDLWSLEDSTRFSINVLVPSFTKLQQKITAELPYDPTSMSWPMYAIKTAVSSTVALVQYCFDVLSQLDFSVKTALDLVNQNKAGSVDAPQVIFGRIQDTFDEYHHIIAPANSPEKITYLQIRKSSRSIDDII